MEKASASVEQVPSPEVATLASQERSFLETFRGKKKRLASALALMTVLSVGKEVVKPSVVHAGDGTPTPEGEHESSQTLFSKISETYQTFEVDDQESVLRQLELYEKNKDLLGSIPIEKQAEFLHQWVFTKIQDVENRYGQDDLLMGVAIEQDVGVPEGLQGDINTMSEFVHRAREALELRRVTANGEDWGRTVGVKTEAEIILTGLTAQTPEAVDAKRTFVEKIKKVFAHIQTSSYEEIKISFDNTVGEPTEEDLLSPNVHISVVAENSDGVRTIFPYSFYYDASTNSVTGKESNLSDMMLDGELESVENTFLSLMQSDKL